MVLSETGSPLSNAREKDGTTSNPLPKRVGREDRRIRKEGSRTIGIIRDRQEHGINEFHFTPPPIPFPFQPGSAWRIEMGKDSPVVGFTYGIGSVIFIGRMLYEKYQQITPFRAGGRMKQIKRSMPHRWLGTGQYSHGQGRRLKVSGHGPIRDRQKRVEKKKKQ